MRFTAETSEGLEMKNFTSAITYPSPDWLTLVIPFPHPKPHKSAFRPHETSESARRACPRKRVPLWCIFFALPAVNGPLPAELKFRENTAVV